MWVKYQLCRSTICRSDYNKLYRFRVINYQGQIFACSGYHGYGYHGYVTCVRQISNCQIAGYCLISVTMVIYM